MAESGVATGSRASTAGGPQVYVRGVVGDEEREYARTAVGAGRGEIVRRKSCRSTVGAPCRAAAVLGAMDYDVYLYPDGAVLTAGQAADQLAEGWLPFVFFTESHSGRGNLRYRRYDGNLGLVTPIDKR